LLLALLLTLGIFTTTTTTTIIIIIIIIHDGFSDGFPSDDHPD